MRVHGLLYRIPGIFRGRMAHSEAEETYARVMLVQNQ